MKITIGSVLEYLISNSYYMQLVWTKYLSLYKGNDCCRTKSFILLVERFLYFLFRFYYLSLLWEKIFYISFGFSRYCLMFLYKTFRNLYKTKYFLYKNRRKFRHVFSAFSGSFYADCGFFLLFSLDFSGGKIRFFNPTVRQWQNLFLSAVYLSCFFRMIR